MMFAALQYATVPIIMLNLGLAGYNGYYEHSYFLAAFQCGLAMLNVWSFMSLRKSRRERAVMEMKQFLNGNTRNVGGL